MSKRWRDSIARQIFWWIYGIQALIVFPWFLGEIGRGEMQFWPWRSRHADGWALAIDVYMHFIFYSVFYCVPYQIFRLAYENFVLPKTANLFAPISLWFMATVMLFHKPILDFMLGLIDFMLGLIDDYVPIWYQWLTILWLASTVCIFRLWRAISKEKRELRRRGPCEEVGYDHWDVR